jgi:hypothetical protein
MSDEPRAKVSAGRAMAEAVLGMILAAVVANAVWVRVPIDLVSATIIVVADALLVGLPMALTGTPARGRRDVVVTYVLAAGIGALVSVLALVWIALNIAKYF